MQKRHDIYSNTKMSQISHDSQLQQDSILDQILNNPEEIESSDISFIEPEILLFNELERISSPAQSRILKRAQIIPILNKETANPVTYDLQSLLNPKTQIKSLARHRCKQSTFMMNNTSSSQEKSMLSFLHKLHRKTQSYSNLKSQAPKLLKVNNVGSRLNGYIQKKEDKLEKQREKLLQQELSQCSFRPSINEKKKNRSFKKYYNDMLRYKQTKEKKLDKQREIKKTVQGTVKFKFRPRLNSNSIKIVANKSSMNRISQEHVQNKSISKYCQLPKYQVQTKPEINQKSKNIQNNKHWAERLYTDAERRLKSSTTCLNPNSQGPLSKSLSILMNRFLREFNYFTDEQHNKHTGTLNYSRFTRIFSQMKLIGENKTEQENKLILQLWNDLKFGDEVDIKDLKVAMMGIMGYYRPFMSNSSSQNFTIEESSVLEFHKKYKLLYDNRGSVMLQNQYFYQQKQPVSVPNIVVNEVDLSVNTYFSGRVQDNHLEKQKERYIKVKVLREKQKMQELKQCTFKPSLKVLCEKNASPSSHRKKRRRKTFTSNQIQHVLEVQKELSLAKRSSKFSNSLVNLKEIKSMISKMKLFEDDNETIVEVSDLEDVMDEEYSGEINTLSMSEIESAGLIASPVSLVQSLSDLPPTLKKRDF